jgi:hypothetical protein
VAPVDGRGADTVIEESGENWFYESGGYFLSIEVIERPERKERCKKKRKKVKKVPFGFGRALPRQDRKRPKGRRP